VILSSTTVLQNSTGLQVAIYKGPIFKAFSICTVEFAVASCREIRCKIKGFYVCNTVVLEAIFRGLDG
jgi:hypothetical protein